MSRKSKPYVFAVNDPELPPLVDYSAVYAQVTREVRKLRAKAKLSQGQVADMIGTTQAIVAHMEDPKFGGYSITMLQRIAAALGHRVEVRFVPEGK
jgi:predicted XRE-type DNA-binding protein